jgi:ketosteroid isomerase-like protein
MIGRMKRAASMLVAAAIAAATVASPRAPSAREVLIRLEQRWVEALERRDAEAVGAILADDFVDTTYRGERRTRREALAGLTSPQRAPATQELSDLDARVYGTTGIVTGINSVTGRNPDFSVRLRFTDVFVKSRGVWKAVSAQETLVASAP